MSRKFLVFLGWSLVVLLCSLPFHGRIFLFQPFNLPSGSMKPTLLVGDYVFVSKYTYGYTRYSFPFSPHLFSGRVFAAEPKRGDVVVFRLPRDTSVDFIKRVVGLPGDRIRMVQGVLNINGALVKLERVDDFVETDERGRTVRAKRWRETLPNGASYATLARMDNGFQDNTEEYLVPPGHYFVLGDHRDNSTDSRTPASRGGIGFVPFENLIGRVGIIFFSTDGDSARYERVGMIVR